ncbi:MAG: EAL domain-containing protein [Candidatus Altimarinota bacterium]
MLKKEDRNHHQSQEKTSHAIDGVSISTGVMNILKPFELIIDEIRTKFLAGEDDFEEFQKYFQDYHFLEKVNAYILDRFRQIVESNSLNSYNEIYFFLYLFSLKVGESIFDNGDIYNEKNFTGLLEKYVSKIQSIEDLNTIQADIQIQSFARLCGVLNLICVLSQNNNLKREFIFSLIEFVSEKIQEVLSYLQKKGYNNKKITHSLEYILGLFPLNYSYIKYLQFDEKGTDQEKKLELNQFLQECRYMFDATISGYEKCRESEFGNAPHKEAMIGKVLLTNIAYIVSLIVLKLEEKINEQDCFDHPIFIEILKKFKEYMPEILQNDIIKCTNFEDVRNICNVIFIKNSKNYHTIRFINRRQGLADYLKHICSQSLTEVDDLENIHHLVLFNPTISRDILFQLLEKFCDQPNSSNINFEVIRLKILNIILTRLAPLNQEKLKIFLKQLLIYVDKYKISSHLLYVYSLMYVTIGYCYSFFDDEESQLQAQENYAKFTQINYGDFDFQRYGIDIGRYYYNFGMGISNRYGLVGLEHNTSQKEDVSQTYDESQIAVGNLIRLGKGQLDDYSKMYTEKTIHGLLNDLDTFLSSQKGQSLNLSDLSTQVSRILSNIFHGVADIEIIDKHSGKKMDAPRHSAYRDFSIMNRYVLRMSYPSAFAPDFEYLYRTFAKLEHNTEEEIENLIPEGVIGKIYQKLEIFLKRFEKNGTALQLAHIFENALNNKGVHVYFQGIYNQDKHPVRFEMLSRVQQNSGDKQYNIKDFISGIEQIQRDDLLKRLIRHIILKAVEIIRDFPDTSLSINMEYGDIVDEELITLLENLTNQGFPANKIALELIESKWSDDDIILNNLKRLKQKGFKIAMDDFGAGESNINRLLRLLEAKLLDIVKIDGGIVKALSTGEKTPLMYRVRKKVANIIMGVSNKNNPTDNESVIKMIVSVCKNHGVSVVAEYIENKELFEKLKKMGVSYFQGYYLSKPIPEKELLKEIDNKK